MITRHGGRLQAARIAFPDAPAPFLDLSTGINPHPYPLGPLSAAAATRLPEPETEDALRALVATRYGARSADGVVLAPGSQILISLLPTLLGSREAVILSPTYGEHEAAWRASGASVLRVPDALALAAQAAPGRVLVLCNPNNPDGRRLGMARLRDLVDRCTATGALLVVDEAFADLEPDVPQAAALLPGNRLVVLRSFGKSYGLAGLRLGFLLTDPDRAARLRTLLGPWPVSGPALEAGLQALADPAWLARMAQRLHREAERLDLLLANAGANAGTGLSVVGGTCLFRLAHTEAAGALHDRLGRAGLLVRRFEQHPDRLRFGLPSDEAAWSRLRSALG